MNISAQLSRRGLLMGVAGASALASCGGGGGGGGGVSSPVSSGSASSSSSTASASGPTLPDPATAPALKTYFNGKFLVGMTAEPSEINNAISQPVLKTHANSMTAENCMKPLAIGTSAGVYNYTLADQVIAFASANNIAVRGHTLLWHLSAPDWFFAGDSTSATYRATVQARLERYITDVVTYFKGKVYAWDVVNEPTSDSTGSPYRNSRWYQVLGADYIEIALRAARAADSTVKLFINDYSTENTDKLARLMSIVDTLLMRGAPLDGIGHQLHITTTWPPVANVRAAFQAVETRGLINHVTELDVSLYGSDPGSCYGTPATGCAPSLTEGTTAYWDSIRAQAAQYRAMYDLFASQPSVKSVTTWGVADNHTWLTSYPVNRLNHPLLFDTTGKPKSAFWAVVNPSFVP